ncbi:MAG TPA: hypothetical protein VJ783_10910 [Pirellulales bacterium]|nr:hypothetical protein [Pirellulales bacterium]
MPSIADVAKDLLANPRPVLCLDTCELLAAVQGLSQGRGDYVAALFRLYTSFTAKPDCVMIVVTELVVHEFGQNIAAVRTKATEFLAKADAESARIHRAFGHINQPLPTAPSNHVVSPLVAELAALAQQVLNAANILDNAPICTDRAISRVRAKERPSHDGRIKDSLHIEHYLELSRQLHNQGFQKRRVFVSGNRGDFCQGRNSSHLHASLDPQFAAAGLEFFASLAAALGSLRI